MTPLISPGRLSICHNQFFADYTNVGSMRIIGLDVGSANFMYDSGSEDLILCSNERYWLELHKLLLLSPAHTYIKECWENKFGSGQDWTKRCKVLSAYNNRTRGKILRNWSDVAEYYCVLSMSGFSYFYDKWRLIGEHYPVTPNTEYIREWYLKHKDKSIYFERKNIYNFPIKKLNENTLLYIHLPASFSSYGCGYSWTRRKFDFISRELNGLASEGYKVCVSYVSGKYGLSTDRYKESFDPDLFSLNTYTELKADRQEVTEAYLVANL